MARRDVAWVALVLLTSGCLGKQDAAQVEAANQRFFAQGAAKQYEAMYDAAAPELRAATPKDVFIGYMERIDRRLGPCQAPVKSLNYRFNASTNGYFATQGYTRVCANGPLTITVTTVLRHGEAKIAGYDAESPLLLTD
jgi:hypothetical protein